MFFASRITENYLFVLDSLAFCTTLQDDKCKLFCMLLLS